MRTIFLPKPIQTHFFLAASIVGVLSFTACERKTATVEMPLPVNPTPAMDQSGPVIARNQASEVLRLSVAVDLFEKNPTMENQASVKLALGKLDDKIADLNDRSIKTIGADRADALTQLNDLQKDRDMEVNRFTKDQDGLALDANSPGDNRSAVQTREDRDDGVGEKVEEGAKKVGRTVGGVIRKTGEAISGASQ